MSITQVSTYVIEDGSVTKEKLNLSTLTTTDGQVLAIDGAGDFYFTDRFVEEEVDDRVAALINAGTHSNISIVYDDVANTLSFSATGAVSSVNGQTGVIVLDTDDIAEGVANLYYTTSRVLGEFSATGDLTYDSANGIFSVTTYKSTDFDTDFASKTTSDLTEGTNLYYTDTRARNSISVSDLGGDGSLSYNNATGVITYTGPSATEVRAHFTGGTGVTITNGEISIGQDVSITSDVVFNNIDATGNVVVEGNLTVQGTTTTINAQNLSVSDNMIYLNNAGQATITNAVGNGTTVTYTANNSFVAGYTVDITSVDPVSFNVTDATIVSANATSFTINSSVTDTYVSGGEARAHANTNVDLGWAGSYDDGTYAHAGLFRDATDGVFKIFDGYTLEPDDSVFIDTSHPSFNLASFAADGVTATYFTGDGANLTSVLTNYSTTDLVEGTNLYFTDERVDDRVAALLVGGDNITVTYDDANNVMTISAASNGGGFDLSNNDTDDLAEGVTNLYFTDERAQDAVAGALVAGPNITIVYDDISNTITITGEVEDDLSNNTTDDLAEGLTNLYYTDTRVRNSISVSGDLVYDSANGIISFTEITETEIRNLFSATDDLIYDSANGIFSVTTYKSTDFDTDFAAKTTDDLTEGLSNLYYTDARARASISVDDSTGGVLYDPLTGVVTVSPLNAQVIRNFFSATSGVSYDTANGIFSLDTTYSPTFVDMILTGNLTVQGTTTTVNTEEVLIADNILTLNSDVTGTPSENAGIEVQRGTSNNVGIRWNETVDSWQFSNDGITYQNIGSLSASNTDDLGEGTTNLYFTDERAQDALGNIIVGGNNITFTYDDANNVMTFDSDISSTTDLPEGTNLYYTDTRWDDKMAAASTDNLSEGLTNLYYTDTRADARVDILRTDLTVSGNASVHFDNLTNVPTVSTQVVVGDGVTMNYTLNSNPGTASGLIITLNGVTQEPTFDYTVSGTTLSFVTPLPSGQRALIRYVGYQISGGTVTYATDSDLLGGLSNTQFLRSDTDDTMVGNLTMTGNIVPSANVTYNLGSPTNRWNELWLSTTTVNLGDNSLSADSNNTPLWNSVEMVLADVATDLIPVTDNTYNLGSPTKQYASVYGHSIEATYADLAERYEIDGEFEIGSVVVFGGDKEITLCKKSADVSVAGVISTDPAFKMNTAAGNDETHPYVALRGRVPCKVVGPVRKGDLLVTSSTFGYAKSVGKTDMGLAVFAKSITEDLSEGPKTIEVVII